MRNNTGAKKDELRQWKDDGIGQKEGQSSKKGHQQAETAAVAEKCTKNDKGENKIGNGNRER